MRELQVLSRERQVLVLQIEALRAEAQQAERDLEDQHDRHQTELQCLKEESLQVGAFGAVRKYCCTFNMFPQDIGIFFILADQLTQQLLNPPKKDW